MVSPCLAGASNGSRGTEGAKAADISKPWYLSIAGSSECLSKIWYLGFDPSVYKRRDDNLSACFFFFLIFYVDSMVLPEASNARSEGLLLGVPRGHL